MTRARRRDAKRKLYGVRFSRTVDEEVEQGIAWADYRHKLSPFLLPRPGDSAGSAAASIRLARQNEIEADEIEEGTPGTPPPWPHWEGSK